MKTALETGTIAQAREAVSMIGHHEERWRAIGWAAARLDDGLNLAPARLGGVLICLQLAGPISYDGGYA